MVAAFTAQSTTQLHNLIAMAEGVAKTEAELKAKFGGDIEENLLAECMSALAGSPLRD